MPINSRIYPSWNPSTFRNNSFPDCHWKLCLQFMDRNKNLLPDEQLLALSHIFANIQLLLRGDVDQTMQLVLDLVKDQLTAEVGAAEEVDHVENSRWEREAESEFLESSPVVEMEALDISTSHVEVTVKEEPEEMAEVSEEAVSEPDCPETEVMDTSDCKNVSNPEVGIKQLLPAEVPKDTASDPKPAPEVATKFIRVVPTVEPFLMENVYNSLILIDANFEKTQTYFNRLKCGRLEVTLKQQTDLSYIAMVKIDRRVLAQACAKKRGQAQAKAIQLFFANMRDHCFRIETLLSTQNLIQSATSNIVPRQTALQLQQANSPERINESNLGFRMLQKIGWTGGPLGANAQGRLDPVECSTLRKGRAGIGAVQEDAIDPAHYRQLMKDFQARNEGHPLVFSAEFTNHECAELQRIASQLRLDGRIFTLPKGVKRFVVMARELPPQEIVRRVVIEQDVGLSAQYRVFPPKRCASFSKANPAPPDVVPDCPKSQKAQKSVRFTEDKDESTESENDSQLSSGEEDEAFPASLSHLPLKATKKSTLDPASYTEILDSLTLFKPIRPLRSIEDVFHNMVLVGHTVAKTGKEFKKVGTGLLQFTNQPTGDGGFCARIGVGEFILVEVFDRVRKKAKKSAEATFFKKAAMFCYRLTPRNSKKDMRNAITRKGNPKTNIEYYRDIIQSFSKDCVEQELVFGTEFTEIERKMLQSIAHGFNLRAVAYGSKDRRHLRVIGQCLPALAIVERIVVHKDPRLSARYELTPPRIGARVEDGDRA